MLFRLDNLSFAYADDKKVVNNLNIELAAGKFYGLVGPNGCGKTTLLDLLIGAQQPQQGRVLFQGRQVLDFAKRQLAQQIALVPQNFNIYFSFTVLEVVLMGRHPYISRFGGPTADDFLIAEQAMSKIGISTFRDRFINELSGGEKQRVVVARALAQQTPVLMLDEATASLDIKYTLEIFNVVRKQVRTQQQTVIAVIHNLNLAAAFCDEIIFMKNGLVVVAGETEQVMTAENINQVFGVKSKVSFDQFSQTLQVSFRA